MKNSESPEISVITNLRDFENLSPAWNDLLKRSNVDNPFLTFEWQYTWWKKFGNKKKLCIIVAKQNDEIVGLAPLMLSRFSFFRIIEFIGMGISDYLGFILDKEHPSVTNDLLNFLLAQRETWDLINLRDIDVSNFKNMEACTDNNDFGVYGRLYEKCPYIEITKPWGEFIKNKGAGFRRGMKSRLNNIDKKGKVELINYPQNGISGDELVKIIWDIERKSWKLRAGTAHFIAKERREFMSKVFDEFSAKEWLDAICLKIDGEFVAYSIGYLYNGKMYNYEVGYKKNCPGGGTYLTWHHIKRSFEEGLREYDFLRGDESYKLRWTEKYWELDQVVIYKQHSILSLMGYWLLFKLRWKLSNYRWLHRLILTQKALRGRMMSRSADKVHPEAT